MIFYNEHTRTQCPFGTLYNAEVREVEHILCLICEHCDKMTATYVECNLESSNQRCIFINNQEFLIPDNDNEPYSPKTTFNPLNKPDL